jgi:CspA family cold shock protein
MGANMAVGTVKFFNTTKGYGFIAPEGGGKDVFVHATAVEAAGLRTLNEGQKVSFDIQPDARGSKAVNLRSA